MKLLIPIGDFPFFTQACLKNIKDTAGTEWGDVEVCFLKTAATPTPAGLADRHEVWEAPMTDTSRGVHLKLLDWAVRRGVSETFVVQHADMFWKGGGWVEALRRTLPASAVSLPYKMYDGAFKHHEFKFSMSGRNLIRTHDFWGAYNMDDFRRIGLKFIWGKLSEVGSDSLVAAAEDGAIDWVHRGEKLTTEQEIDGSDAIGLELALRHAAVKELADCPGYCHFWDLFGMGWDMSRQGRRIAVNRTLEKSVRGLAAYSWVSSHLFDVSSMYERIFPWSALLSIIPGATKPTGCEILEKYRDTDNVLGNGRGGVEEVKFLDRSFILGRIKL